MNELAESTGGFAIHNTNGPKQALSNIVESNNNYYSFAYAPKNFVYDGRFRKITVSVAGMPRLRLTYRRGYYAADTAASHHPLSQDGADPIELLMRRGAPDATQILFKVSVMPAPLTVDSKPPEVSGAQDYKGAVRYRIDWAIDLHAVTFTTSPQGLKFGTITLSATAYDADGQQQKSDSNELALTFKPAQYQAFLKVGLQRHQTIDLPPGDTFLHLGVMDGNSQNKGSTEIPIRVAKPDSPK